MCKVCTEAVHCVALWTRVTLGLGTPFKPPRSPLQRWRLQAPLKPPWSPLQAPLKPSEGEAPFKPPWSPLQAPLKPLEAPFTFGRFQAPFKPPWSPLQAPLKPPSSLLQGPPSEGEAPLKPSEGEAPFKPSWRVPSKGASLKVKPPSSLKGALPEGPRNLPGHEATHFFTRAGGAQMWLRSVRLWSCPRKAHHWQSLLTAGDRPRGPHLKKLGQLSQIGVSHPGQEILMEVTYQTVVGVRFFLLAAAWVDPGRSALQWAEQWCKDAMVRFTRLVKSHFLTIACKGRSNNSQTKRKWVRWWVHLCMEHVWAGHAHFYLHESSPPDESFIDMLKQNCCLSGPHFPPRELWGLARLCHSLLQGTSSTSHCCWSVAAMEVHTAPAREITDQLWRYLWPNFTQKLAIWPLFGFCRGNRGFILPIVPMLWAASSTKTWVNLRLAYDGSCRNTTCIHCLVLRLWGLLWVRFAMSSRSSTERLGDFLKAYVSHCFLGVFLDCLVFFGCCWVFVFRVAFETPSFLLSPTIKQEYWWPSELWARTAWAQKKHVVWAPSGQRALHHHSGAVDLPMDMLWMALNVHVTWCGLKEMGNLILCWIPLQLTRLFWIKIFRPCNTSMTPLHLFLKFVSAGKLWPYLAQVKMSSHLTCTLLELGCCALG